MADIFREWMLYMITHVDKYKDDKDHCDLCREYIEWCEKRDKIIKIMRREDST